MHEDRPYLQIPVPDQNEAKLYEEWLKKQKEQEEASKEESPRVIIIEL
tara:strand:- start:1164 stop:1307 length:144 start_codon:yes stop_codon:yes gene_type:complete